MTEYTCPRCRSNVTEDQLVKVVGGDGDDQWFECPSCGVTLGQGEWNQNN